VPTLHGSFIAHLGKNRKNQGISINRTPTRPFVENTLQTAEEKYAG